MVTNSLRALACSLVLIVTGCAAQFPEAGPALDAPTQMHRLPPKELVTMIKEIIAQPPMSLSVEQEQNGSILTGYQRFPGEWHIGRRWQERTRFRIMVIPDWNEPTAAGRIEVREQTEQRAAEGMEWKPAYDLHRPERAKELLNKLNAEIERRSNRQ